MGEKKPINLDAIPFSLNELFGYSNKDYIKNLKTKLKNRYQKKNLIFVKNARTGLYLTLQLMNLKKTDEIIIPAYTSKPVLTSVKNLCKPLFVDINTDDNNINLDNICEKITSNTKAIITTNTYGKSDEMDILLKIAKENKLTVIENIAQAPFGEYNGKNLGSFGEFTVLSFGPYKDVSCFYGGAVLCNEELPENDKISNFFTSLNCFLSLSFINLFEHIKSIRKFENLSSSINKKMIAWERQRKIIDPIKKQDEITNYMAYLLEIQIKKIDKKIKTRRKNAEFYLKNIESNFNYQKKISIYNHTFYRFTIKVKHRDELFRQGLLEGIYLGKIYDYYLAPLPNSIIASKRNICIPVHHNLVKEDRIRIVNFINKFV